MGTRWLVYGARAAALGTISLEAIPPMQLAQHLFYGDLLAQPREVETVAERRQRSRRGGRVPGARNRRYHSQRWGDRLPFGTLSFAAPSFFCFPGWAARFAVGARLRHSERLVGLPDREDQMHQFLHAMS